MKKLIIILSLSLSFVWISFWYFEDKYYCNISDSNIQVSLSSWINSIKCMDYIRWVTIKINDMQNNISKIDGYIKSWTDKDYWEAVRVELVEQNQKYIWYKDRINMVMKIFEESLFSKIKKLLTFYLNKDYLSLQKDYNELNNHISQILNNGNISNYNILISQRESAILQLNILKNIFDSSDFNMLIPYLKYYIKNYSK